MFLRFFKHFSDGLHLSLKFCVNSFLLGFDLRLSFCYLLLVAFLKINPSSYVVVHPFDLHFKLPFIFIIFLHLMIYSLLERPGDFLLYVVHYLLLDVAFDIHSLLELMKGLVILGFHIYEHLAHLTEFVLDFEHPLLGRAVDLLNNLSALNVAPNEVHGWLLHLVESKFLLNDSAPPFEFIYLLDVFINSLIRLHSLSTDLW